MWLLMILGAVWIIVLSVFAMAGIAGEQLDPPVAIALRWVLGFTTVAGLFWVIGYLQCERDSEEDEEKKG